MLFREEEELVNTYRYDSLASDYIYFKIKDFFNLSLFEFLNLNRWEIDKLIFIAKREMDRKTRESEELDELLESKLKLLEKGYNK